MVKMGLRRSRPVFLMLTLLYTLLYLQLSVFFYLILPGFENVMIFTGYSIGLSGFMAGMTGVHYSVVGKYSYEFGNLETIGFSRFTCIRYYLLQFGLVILSSILPSAIIFQILYTVLGSNEIPFLSMLVIHIKTSLILSVFHLITVFVALWVRSRPEPFLLIRERL